MTKYIILFFILSIILSYPSYFLYKKLIYKIYKKASREFIIFVTIVSPFIWTFIVYQICFEFIKPMLLKQKFDIEVWRKEPYERYKMVKDILSHKTEFGKSKVEFINKFGAYFEKGPCENCIGYSISDPDELSLIDHEVLVFYFDKKNKLIQMTTNSW